MLYQHLNIFFKVVSHYQEYIWNIEWTEKLIRNHHQDREIPVLSHNDAHAGNMMMNKTDFTGESLILIDWDITHYGYRIVLTVTFVCKFTYFESLTV